MFIKDEQDKIFTFIVLILHTLNLAQSLFIIKSGPRFAAAAKDALEKMWMEVRVSEECAHKTLLTRS